MRIFAPALFTYEVTNALFMRVANGQLLLAEGRRLLTALMKMGPVIPVNLEFATHLKAMQLAATYSLDTSQDAHYLALAELRGCDLWTADKRLVDAVHEALPWVHWIGERRGIT